MKRSQTYQTILVVNYYPNFSWIGRSLIYTSDEVLENFESAHPAKDYIYEGGIYSLQSHNMG